MKRKEFMKRLMSITMAAMMATTMVPTSAFASDADFFTDAAGMVSDISDDENAAEAGGFSDGEITPDDSYKVYEDGSADSALDLYADGESGGGIF